MAYWTAFPESHAKMDDTFKQDLLNVVHEWATGNRTHVTEQRVSLYLCEVNV